MATIPELLVKIGADLSGFKRGMAAVVSSVQETEAKITGAGKTINHALEGLAFGYGLHELYAGAKESITKFAEQEAAVVSLGASLRATGRGGRAALEQIAGGAGKVEEATGILDDDIMRATARLAQYARRLTAGDLTEAQKAIVAFSVKTGNDLDTSAKLIGRALSSNQNVLGRQGIELDLNANQTGRLAQLNRQLAASYEVAKAEMNTTQGAMTRIRNGFEKVKEAIGGILVRSLGMGNGLEDFGKALYRLADTLRKNAGTFAAWGKAIFTTAQAVGVTLSALTIVVYRSFTGIWHAMTFQTGKLKADVDSTKNALKTLGSAWVDSAKAIAALGDDHPGLAEGAGAGVAGTPEPGGGGKKKGQSLAQQIQERIRLFDLEVQAGRKSLDDKLAMIDREIAAHRKNTAIYLDLMKERLQVTKQLREEYLRTLEVLRETMKIAPTPTERRERASELAQYGLHTPGVKDLVQQAGEDLKNLTPVKPELQGGTPEKFPMKIQSLGDLGKAVLQIRSLGDAGALLKASFGFLMKTVLPLAVIAEFVSAAMKPLEPALNALKAPIQLLATAIGTALIPILKALFPVIKIAVIAISYLGSAIGIWLKTVFGVLSKIPFIGKAFKGLADAGSALVKGMADTRTQLKGMTWESAQATDGVSALGSAAKNASEDLKNLPSSFKYTLRKFQSTAAIPWGGPGTQPGDGSTSPTAPGGRYARPRAAATVVNIAAGAVQVTAAATQSARDVAKSVVQELRRQSLQVTGTQQLATAWGG